LFKRTLQGIAFIRSAGIGCLVTSKPTSEQPPTGQNWLTLLQRTLKPHRIQEDPRHGQNNPNLYMLSG
jgi:hypothetical protein